MVADSSEKDFIVAALGVMILAMEALFSMLRPPGDGIATISAGGQAALPLLRSIYGMNSGTDSAELVAAWRRRVTSDLATSKVILVGVPLDTGAGIRRGAAYGPRGIREHLYRESGFLSLVDSHQVLDLGDIFVNPHLLHDEMLEKAQIQQCQDQMYTALPEAQRRALPVSGLSMLKTVLQLVFEKNSGARLMILGGDHSVAWPVSEVVIPRHQDSIGIVQSDAHTDLLDSRFGVKYCFGSWSFHANELLGRGQRLVQVGIRETGKPKVHWENTLQVKQVWAAEVSYEPASKRPPGQLDPTIDAIVAHLRARGVKQLYFSNDIDGTDVAEAPATGTPAAGGLSSDFLLELMDRLGKEFEWVAADLVEVAPVLGPTPQAAEQTLALSVRYVMASIHALLRSAERK